MTCGRAVGMVARDQGKTSAMRYEYKVVPAPARGAKAKGVKGAEARFVQGLAHVLNDMGAAGWEYLRAETLPSEERSGLTGSVTVWRTVLVFRRAVAGMGATEGSGAGLGAAGLGAAGLALGAAEAPVEPEPAVEPDWQRPVPTPVPTPAPAEPSVAESAAEQAPAPAEDSDNGVEETRDIDAPSRFLQSRGTPREG